MDSVVQKQPWSTPELSRFGRVEDLTAQTVKYSGYNDGVSYDPDGPEGSGDGDPIGTIS